MSAEQKRIAACKLIVAKEQCSKKKLGEPHKLLQFVFIGKTI